MIVIENCFNIKFYFNITIIQTNSIYSSGFLKEQSIDSERNSDYINVRSIKLNEEEGKRKLLVREKNI